MGSMPDAKRVRVADSGAGVDEALAVGMGLTASRAIIDAHGGSLWAVNDGSSGAVFTCALPAAAP